MRRLRTHATGLVLVAALVAVPAAAPALSSGDLIKQGIQALRDGKNRDALELFTRAERLEPNSPKPHYYIAAALERLEYPDSAQTQFLMALKENPRYTDALVGLGNLLR
ncbi:MAG TPA: hypothetical protein VID50_03075, partial [Candidatus Eisenbacteria bacterium]